MMRAVICAKNGRTTLRETSNPEWSSKDYGIVVFMAVSDGRSALKMFSLRMWWTSHAGNAATQAVTEKSQFMAGLIADC